MRPQQEAALGVKDWAAKALKERQLQSGRGQWGNNVFVGAMGNVDPAPNLIDDCYTSTMYTSAADIRH